MSRTLSNEYFGWLRDQTEPECTLIKMKSDRALEGDLVRRWVQDATTMRKSIGYPFKKKA